MASLGAGALPEPPAMPRRAIGPPSTLPSTRPDAVRVVGEDQLVALDDRGVKFLLFVPGSYIRPASGKTDVVLHFHGAPWFVIDEARRYGLDKPMAVFALGEGSRVYARPFEDPERFGRVIDLVASELARRDGATSVGEVEITSFSAGYGAVREIIKRAENVARLSRVILCDSMYAGWDAPTPESPTSRPAAGQISPWVDLARRAAKGELVFVVTYSMVETPYASSAVCARAVAAGAGVEITPVERGSLPATLAPDYPLLERGDAGGFHVWGYGGKDAGAHMTHVRHLADVVAALRKAGK